MGRLASTRTQRFKFAENQDRELHTSVFAADYKSDVRFKTVLGKVQKLEKMMLISRVTAGLLGATSRGAG